MEQSRLKRRKKVKHSKVTFMEFCCMPNVKSWNSRMDSTLNENEVPSADTIKRRHFDISTSFGSDLELTLTKDYFDSNRKDFKTIKYFPRCEDLPGRWNDHVKGNSTHDSRCSRTLSDLSSNSDAISNFSSITLKDILDHCDSSSAGSPSFPPKTFPDLLSLKNSISKRSSYKRLNINTNCIHNAYESEEVEGQAIPYVYSANKTVDHSPGRIRPSELGYEIVESITLKAIGKGITSLNPSSPVRQQSRNELSRHVSSDSNSPISLPPRMPLLPSLPIKANGLRFDNEIGAAHRIRNLSYSISRSSQGFRPGSEDDEIYQDIDNIQVLQSFLVPTKHPPSSLFQSFNNSNLKRSCSSELGPFAHLPTKKSDSNVSLTRAVHFEGPTLLPADTLNHRF